MGPPKQVDLAGLLSSEMFLWNTCEWLISYIILYKFCWHMWLHGDPTKIIISNSLSLPKKKNPKLIPFQGLPNFWILYFHLSLNYVYIKSEHMVNLICVMVKIRSLWMSFHVDRANRYWGSEGERRVEASLVLHLASFGVRAGGGC